MLGAAFVLPFFSFFPAKACHVMRVAGASAEGRVGGHGGSPSTLTTSGGGSGVDVSQDLCEGRRKKKRQGQRSSGGPNQHLLTNRVFAAKAAQKPAEEAARGPHVNPFNPSPPPPPSPPFLSSSPRTARAIRRQNIPCSGAADTWNNVVIDVSFDWRRHMPEEEGGGRWEWGCWRREEGWGGSWQGLEFGSGGQEEGRGVSMGQLAPMLT